MEDRSQAFLPDSWRAAAERGGGGLGPDPETRASLSRRLPYSFGNFVWWSDDELRSLLKKRIPGLGDEIATTTAAEGRVRDALKALLKEKGITAEVQSQEPSYSSFGGFARPGSVSALD